MAHPDDMVSRYCVVCGALASNRHHEPPKGLGGIGRKGTEPPVVSLCGHGNMTGCHGARHRGELELRLIGGAWYWRGRNGHGMEADVWRQCHGEDFWEGLSWMRG